MILSVILEIIKCTMKISIITVTYNSEKFLGSCIESVINQNYANIEYIIIDGGSVDQTLEIIRSYNGKIDKWVSEPDGGIYEAMNKGIDLASGDVIGILNSDDIYHDHTVISDVMARFTKNQELDILYGDIVYVSKRNLNRYVRRWQSKPYFKNFFEYANVPPHPAMFVKAHVYQKVGKFNLQYRFAADYEFMLRILKVYHLKSEYLSRLIVRMRLGGVTNSSLRNIYRANLEVLKSWKNNGLSAPASLMPLRIIKRLGQYL